MPQPDLLYIEIERTSNSNGGADLAEGNFVFMLDKDKIVHPTIDAVFVTHGQFRVESADNYQFNYLLTCDSSKKVVGGLQVRIQPNLRDRIYFKTNFQVTLRVYVDLPRQKRLDVDVASDGKYLF